MISRASFVKSAPRFASVHLQINFTADGYVWIGVPRSTAMKDLELLDGTGKTVLSASLPPGHSLTNGTRSTVWTVSSDSDDLPVLTRFRVKQ